MKNEDEVKILGVDVENTSFEYDNYEFAIKMLEMQNIELKLYQKIYLKMMLKTNGLFTKFDFRKRH